MKTLQALHLSDAYEISDAAMNLNCIYACVYVKKVRFIETNPSSHLHPPVHYKTIE